VAAKAVRRFGFRVVERVEEAGHLVSAEDKLEFLDRLGPGDLGEGQFLSRVML
jgi:hypothetical protein